MPLQATSGAASYDGFGGGVPFEPTYIEQVFATHLYTGNGSFSPKTGVNTITNGIDLASKGGLVWAKLRSSTGDHVLFDTARGVSRNLSTNTTGAQALYSGYGVTSFNSNGFTLEGNLFGENLNGGLDVSWTFRKQPKFFDVVTYTGNGSSQTIAHNLGSTPGCIIIKSTSTAGTSWPVYHRGLATPNQDLLFLNQTASAFVAGYNNIVPSSTNFVVSLGDGDYNDTGRTYVAYLFAHNAGGFGLTGTDNVISCGSFTTNSSGVYSVNLGYEPQWILMKRSSAGALGSWFLYDNMRGLPAISGGIDAELTANTSNAENSFYDRANITATGFYSNNVQGQVDSSATYIYIAIRRGPMKTPTTGTSVFAVSSATEPSSSPFLSPTITSATGVVLAPGAVLSRPRTSQAGHGFFFADRLRGNNRILTSTSTGVEESSSTAIVPPWDFTQGMNAQIAAGAFYNNSGGAGTSSALYALLRAPGFFDVVCTTGNGVTDRNVNHNLGVVPEFIINKPRSYSDFWEVYHKDVGLNSYFYLDSSQAVASNPGNWSTMTSTTFGTGYAYAHNRSSQTYVNYLFASCPGVSKVTNFTGTGSLQTINCGFTGGARLVLIKRTDASGDWYIWDSSRGISSSTDPYLLLNSTAAEVTSTNWVDTTSTGFQVTAASGNNVNINGASYIALAIA